MTSIISQPGFGLEAPTSRHDIVSALLNDYGNSFGGGEVSPYKLSPVPTLKDLPPPPPGSNHKPLPPVMTRFQLRVDEPVSPASSNGSQDSPTEAPTRIVSRSMSRSSKPSSLKLLKSNGATAILSPTQTSSPPSIRSKDDAWSPQTSRGRPVDDRPLPPPPPPPAKSERRQQMQTDNENSRVERKRIDSGAFQSSKENAQEPENPIQSQVVKRKPLKPIGLGELGKPQKKALVQPKSANYDGESQYDSRQSKEEAPSRNALSGVRPTFGVTDASVGKPSSPKEVIAEARPKQTETYLPPAPRKVFAGLPSNPRAKGQEPAVSRQAHGKDGAGFGIMKAGGTDTLSTTIAPALDTITPGPTPSPNRTEAIQTGAAFQGPSLVRTLQASPQSPESLASPVSQETTKARRPFSFEAIPEATRPAPAKRKAVPREAATSPPPPPKVISPPPAEPEARSTSDLAPAPAPAQPQTTVTVPSSDNPLPIRTGPITHGHLGCYTSHANLAGYFSKFQPAVCMVCLTSEPGRRAMCSWCYLQVCGDCRQELARTPGQSLRLLLDQRASRPGVDRLPEVVVSPAEDDFA